MKKEIRKFNDLLAVNRNGNALLLALNLLNIFMVITFSFYIQVKVYSLIKMENKETEILKIQAVKRIKSEFYHQKCENFELYEGSSSVVVIYDELTCRLEFSGQVDFAMLIEYDDVYLCIKSVEYLKDNETY